VATDPGTESLAGGPLRLLVPNRRDAVEPTRQQVHRYLEPLALSEGTLFRLDLVLEEMLLNVVNHAFDDDREHLFELIVEVSGAEIQLQFEDDGRPFDPTTAEVRQQARSIAEAVPGGLGLPLLRQMSSSMSYERVGSRNRLRLAVART